MKGGGKAVTPQLFIRWRVHTDLESDQPCQLDEIIEVFRCSGKFGLFKHIFIAEED